ncbi:cytochrome c-type biogenesis protein [Congregibacter variabilis]|uniref:Cytochrome c-type biogenesis protein n=1 Tax=Congregibacter variabilis TaxID=3081200 RepID=A0ABZ0I3C5_9GAMM|nr:cytochrome c-type biogenesis protein [Congregibacter sp. IMCC43200]
MFSILLKARVKRLAVFLGLVWSLSAVAVIETYEFSTPELEERYRALSQELRCPKCQNQNIADSNAPISQDLRALLFEKLEKGASDEVILEDMVARYGEFVRYRPDTRGAALWLWLAPALMLGAGIVLLIVLLRRTAGASTAGELELTSEERARLDRLINDKASKS